MAISLRPAGACGETNRYADGHSSRGNYLRCLIETYFIGTDYCVFHIRGVRPQGNGHRPSFT
ncbi:MAG: hypothetical protein M1283_01195, partial [Gammaproteobacteria bacterium]|nr:hypothetical protein [Gammaproteobacteria bacterium]